MQKENTEKQNTQKPLTKRRIFGRIQKECFRRSVTVYLMYLFMSLIMLACQAINEGTTAVEVVLGVICILIGMAFNVHLCYHVGCDHYDAYITGCLHRRNALFGIQSGGNHRVEREYRPYKGFLIGFYVGLIVVVLGILAGVFQGTEGGYYALMFLSMFGGWAIIPVGWLITLVNENISYFWSLAFILIPVLVSGISYIVGAQLQRRRKEQEAERAKQVEEAGKRAKEEVRIQTEEQRKKTLQSKKKKK